MDYNLFLDHNRKALLQYRDTGKARHYVGIVDGSIDCLQLGQKDFKGLKPYIKQSPEHFADVMFKSTLPISRAARAILRSVLGFQEGSGAETEGRSAARNSGGTVSLQEICDEISLEPHLARKFLRKNVDKPGGRWEWSPEEAETIRAMLKEVKDADPVA